ASAAASRSRRARTTSDGGRRLLRELLAEALDATGGIEQALLAREERVALRAYVRMNFRNRGARLKRIPAGALDRGRGVLRMDVGFHWNLIGSGAGVEGCVTGTWPSVDWDICVR